MAISPWYAITATFFGAGWIDSIETASDRKIRYRCPNCTSTDFKYRSKKQFAYRCAKCTGVPERGIRTHEDASTP